MPIHPILIMVFVIMAIVPTAFADIQKCKDAKGKITYSSTPCPAQAVNLPVGKIINYENSPQGKEAAAASWVRGESLREKNANDLRLWEEINAPKKPAVPKNISPDVLPKTVNTEKPKPKKDVGPCFGDCGSEQGMCVAQCNNEGRCIGNCSAAWGRCQARCN